MELNNNIDNNLQIRVRDNKLKNILFKTIDGAIDIGIRAVMPDIFENQVINIKDALVKNGLKEGMRVTIDNGLQLGKSVVGIFSGNFENMTQVRMAVEDGGIIDSMSGLLDKIIGKAYEKNHINRTTNKILKNGKNAILKTISDNIGKEINNQSRMFDNISAYISNWEMCFQKNDINGMNVQYNRIKKEKNKLVPLENILKKVKEIEKVQQELNEKKNTKKYSEIEREIIKKL